MGLVSQRQQVASLTAQFAVSERRACELLSMNRSSYRYRPRPSRDEELKHRLLDLARKRPRFGYRRLTALLHREGRRVNHKRVWRLCTELRLSVRWKKRKRLAQAAPPEARATAVNEEWGMDFVSDWAANGQRLRALTIVDVFSRFSPELEVGTSIGSRRVTRVMERAGAVHGYPVSIR
jgi:putative transposase